MKPQQPSRREFLQTSTALSIGAYASASNVFAQGSANEQLQYATIGLGIRGSGINCEASTFGQCVALCDVDKKQLSNANDKLSAQLQKSSRPAMKPNLFGDYREVLERKDVDIVVIGTPDHWHAKIAIESMLLTEERRLGNLLRTLLRNQSRRKPTNLSILG